MADEATPHQDTDPELREYEKRISPFVERFAADLTEAGMQRMAARVFACLLASEDGALTSAQLSERLQASPAAISGAVRYLSQAGMISRQRDPGSRRERYLLHTDVWYTSFVHRDTLLSRWLTTLNTGADALGGNTPGGRRLAESAEFLAFLRKELGSLLERWHNSR
ncbi:MULTISPECIES: GbsR/MarR family transcriptional regulator [Streptomyces]|uniref:GbsR/MarR family transcriptional regulator n=1 Tax=Streptomyces TaxID=1883 RepID=UPI001CECFD36|nr:MULTISPECIES: MarR family transcriptional regulator [Streptomyces]MDI6410962.1 MarR family transcriptional regulator [Streptomyces albus]